jgi:hypothetical protein
MRAKQAIEEFYSIALNPDLDYLSQLQPLAASGELANKLTSNQVLFRLCMIVDAQEKEIKALKDDRVAIAKKMIELESKLPKPVEIKPDQPLG